MWWKDKANPRSATVIMVKVFRTVRDLQYV